MKKSPKSSESVSLDQVRYSLAWLWFIGSGVLFISLFILSLVSPRITPIASEVWSWFVPNVFPTLALMLGVLGNAAFGDADRRLVRREYYRLSWWLSVAYLVVFGLTIALEPFSQLEPLDLFSKSNYGLGPLQGLAVGSIGVVFASQRVEPGRGDPKPSDTGKQPV